MPLTFSNTIQSPLSSALNNKLNPSPLGTPKTSNIGSNLSLNTNGQGNTSAGSPNQVGSLLNTQTNQGLKGSVGGLLGTAGNLIGDVGNFAKNVWNGTSGGYIPMAGFGNSGNTSNSNSAASAQQTANQATTKAENQVSQNGKYVGSQPKYNSSTQSNTQTQNPGYGNSTGSSQSTNVQQPSAGGGTFTSSQPAQPTSGTQANYSPSAGIFGGLTSGLANSSISGNQALSQNAQNIANAAGNAISNVGQAGARGEAGYLSTGTSPVGEGNAAILAQTTAAEQQAIENGANTQLAGNKQGLTAQSQQQAGLNAAAQLTQPQAGAAFFGSPVSGTTIGNSVGGSPLVTQGVQQAIQQAQNGGDPSALESQLQSQFGAPAVQAFQQALLNQSGGTYNPTAASASAQQTASQGAQTGGQAYNLGIALQQVDTIKPVISNFLATSGINSTDSPLYNTPINQYISQLGNPAASQQYATMVNDLQKFSSQIVNSGTALTPTGVTAATALQDPSKLSMSQINYYMNTLQTLGNNQLSVLQGQAKASGYTGYAGPNASASTSTSPAAPSNSPGGGLTSPLAQAAAGTALTIPEDILSTVSGLAAKLFG